jgi:hypothetical protein
VIDLSQNLALPYCYAVVYVCSCGCGERCESLVLPTTGTLEDDMVRRATMLAASTVAEVVCAAGYRDVRVEPRYSTPEIGLN